MNLAARTVLCAALLPALLLSFPAWAQGTQADYDRAARLGELTRNKVFRTGVKANWFAGGTRFWYRNDLPNGEREFVHVDAARAVREPAFDHAKLAAALATATGQAVRATHLPLEALVWVEGQDAVQFTAAGKRWQWGRATGELTPSNEPAPAPPAADPPRRQGRGGNRRRADYMSPDRKWTVTQRGPNLNLSGEGGATWELTTDGKEGDSYSQGQVYWSPDSTRVLVMRTKAGGDRRVTFVESSPADGVTPKVHSFPYLKPGDEIEQSKPHLFEAATRREIPISDALFPNPWSLDRVRWEPDSSRATFLYNQRGHQVMRVVAVDAISGEARAIVDEQPKTFFDYNSKLFYEPVEETGELIWMSERDGWNHLYLYDARSGSLKNQITRGDWVVRGVDRVDEKARQIWFRAGGIDPTQDPYQVHFCRVNFDGTGLVRLTEADGSHSVDWSPDGRFLIDTYSRVDLAPVTELRRAEDGKLVTRLEAADLKLLVDAGWRAPERFVAKGRDGKTDIYGVIYRPTNFDPNRKYPVIEDIYAGPHGSFVPKTFRPLQGPQALAEIGFIVVQIDGMGTNNRSKAFHDVAWKNLMDAGLPDRILWMKAAAETRPFMDLTRVGVYGTSAGGQSSTAAMLTHGDFYKAAASFCGCHDNRVDKIWWNELWMSWPVGPHYAEQSNVTNAHRLQGKLLLMVGEMDRNVDPVSTMQVVNALIKADKDFDLLVVPGADHSMGGAYGVRRMRDFFVKHLLGVEPRSK